jgi:hypothetical protein
LTLYLAKDTLGLDVSPRCSRQICCLSGLGDTECMRAAPFLYVLSLPERTVRSLSAAGGGLLRGVSHLALPAQVREAALYRATAGIGLRFLIEQLGDVYNVYPRHDLYRASSFAVTRSEGVSK